MTASAPIRAVHTALIGGYERLQEQPVAKTTDIPFICFTDDPELTSDTWEIRVVEPALARDPVRSSRFHKIIGEPLVADYDETLWVDNRVILTEDPAVVLDAMLASADLGVIHHSYRTSVIAEFDEVARAGLDEPARVYEQLIHYAESRPHVLDERPYWAGFIARRWTPEVRAAMRTWMDHVLRYSRRDQLSLRYALDGLASVNALDLDNFGSDWHIWITDDVGTRRNTAMRANSFRNSIRAPLAEVAALRAQHEAETARADRAAAQVADLQDRVAGLRARVKRLRKQLVRARARADRLEGELSRRTERRRLFRRRTSSPRRSRAG